MARADWGRSDESIAGSKKWIVPGIVVALVIAAAYVGTGRHPICKRREAIVRNVFAASPVAMIVLGRSHDLTENLPMDAE